MASEGKKAAKTRVNKNQCKKCEKDTKSSKVLKCFLCKEITHYNCLTGAITTEAKELMSSKNEYKCGQCEVYPNRHTSSIENVDDEVIDAIKLKVILPAITESPQNNLPAIENITNTQDLTNYECDRCDYNNTNKDLFEKHQELEHEMTCEECGMKFDTKELLQMHKTVSHDKRGNKRYRQDTSLIFDPSQCTNCDQNKLEKDNLREENGNIKLDNETIKTENEKLKSELTRQKEDLMLVNAAYQETKNNLNSVTKDLDDTKEACKKLTDELTKMREEMRNNPNISAEIQDDIRKKNEQIEIIKEMVVDRDNNIKKMEEAHKKEVIILQKEKKSSDDSLNCVTEENTKLKDKEKTLLDIFKYMKQYMDDQLGESSRPNATNSFSCTDCRKSFTKIDELNFHKRNEHSMTTRKRCISCAFETSSEKDLEKHIQETHGANSKPKFECDECKFSDDIEENVLNHKIENHSIVICDLCDFETTSDHSLTVHIQETHKQTKFPCRTCGKSFKTNKLLREHINSNHTTPFYPCDYCGHKASSFETLDKHIETFHRISKSNSKNDFSKSPCDYKSPQHKSSCCDRDQGKKMKIYTPKERIDNGPCRNWNENVCRFTDLCKFAHIQVCNFQESCRNPTNCLFFHYNKSNSNFLCGTSYRAFVYKKQDFPPLPTRRN